MDIVSMFVLKVEKERKMMLRVIEAKLTVL